MYTSMMAALIWPKSPPPTESLKSVSPEKTTSPLTTKQTMSAECPGVGIASTSRPPTWIDEVTTGSPSSASCATWSPWSCVRSTWLGSTPHSSAARRRGSSGAPESTKTAVPPGSSATRYAFESQPGSMLRSISTVDRLTLHPHEGDAMPGLMNRASTVVKAKISKLLDRAEDPGETLDYSYEKQLELLQNVKRGVADVV